MKQLLLVLILFSSFALGAEKMLHPDFPVVDGHYQMTNEWIITLDQPYNRRVEDGSLVLWRPGFTIWINAWNNDQNESVEQRLAWVKSEASIDAHDVTSKKVGGIELYAYRLEEHHDSTVVYSMNGYVLSKDGHIQISVYFDVDSDYEKAKNVVSSIRHVKP